MKYRNTIFLFGIVGMLSIASSVHARPSEKDLKSDLELEIEGYKEKPSQNKPNKKKPADDDLTFEDAKGVPDLKSSKPTTIPTPRPATPTPIPTPAATPFQFVAPPRATPVPPPVATPTPAPVVATPKPTPAPQAMAPIAPPLKKMNLEELMNLAQRYIDAKKYDEAITLLRPYNDQLPRRGLLLLGRGYEGKGDSQNEIKTLNLCVVKNPKDYVVKVAFGFALIRGKQLEAGLVAFGDARVLNPRYRPAYEAQLAELEKKGERYEARNVVNDMITVFGDKPEFLTALCRLYAADSFLEKTIEMCTLATEKAPKVPENYVFLGLALKEREETDKAQKILVGAAKRFPSSEAVQSAMGELNLKTKDYVNAYNYYKRAVVADQKSTRAWVGYGVSSFELQKPDEALKAFSHACKIDRNAISEFRLALGKLRERKDAANAGRYEMGLNECN